VQQWRGSVWLGKLMLIARGHGHLFPALSLRISRIGGYQVALNPDHFYGRKGSAAKHCMYSSISSTYIVYTTTQHSNMKRLEQ
jgi:hypothetical protein